MRVRFLTSVGGAYCSYIEGRVLDLPDPLPAPFRDWLQQGVIAVEPAEELALAPAAVEQAVRRRNPRRRRGRRESRAADGSP